MVIPSNVHDDLPKGPRLFGCPVTILVLWKLFGGFHEVIPHIRQAVSPSKCSGSGLALRLRSLLLTVLFLLGKPRYSQERQGATQANNCEESLHFILHRNQLSA